MKIQIASDLHREFGNKPLEFDRSADVICLAGDISVSGFLEASLNGLNIPKKTKCLVVKGNHDFWVNPHIFQEMPVLLQNNISVLNRQIKTIKKQRFLGCSLWYDPTDLDRNWADFKYYNEYDILTNHKKDVRFIKENLREGDVEMTHFLPSYKCISPRWRGSDTNFYFVGYEFYDLILEKKPKLWIFGHTHDSVDMMIGETRLICNPYGYEGYDLNKDYETKILEI